MAFSTAFSTSCVCCACDNFTISRPSTTRDIARALHLYRMKFAHRQLIVSFVFRSFTNFAPLTINERDPCLERTKQAAILKPKKSGRKSTQFQINFLGIEQSKLKSKHLSSDKMKQLKNSRNKIGKLFVVQMRFIYSSIFRFKKKKKNASRIKLFELHSPWFVFSDRIICQFSLSSECMCVAQKWRARESHHRFLEWLHAHDTCHGNSNNANWWFP